MKIRDIVDELKRVEKILIESEATGKLIVHSECGTDENPYPIFFTANELMKEINEGSWHCVRWYLKDKEEMKKEILERINILQKRLVRL